LIAPRKAPDTEKSKLENFWKESDLKLKSLDLKDGVAKIHVIGELSAAGICDEPPINSHPIITQFPTVDYAFVV
jgi:hypothetical protein